MNARFRIFLFTAVVAALPLSAAPARGHDYVRIGDRVVYEDRDLVPTAIGDRYVILEAYQADRNLNKGDPRINLLFDTKERRSWVLRHTRVPGTNELGYVWVEIPFASAPASKR